MSEPTQSELAALAATIATGKESTVDEFHRLAERALNLWDGAGFALQIRKDRRELPEMIRAEWNAAFHRAGLEAPEAGRAFTLPEALKFLMPIKPSADRMKALRDFLAATVESELSPQDIGKLKKRGFEYGQFCRFAERFLPWLENDARQKKAKAGRAGGKAGKGLKRKATPATKKRGR